MIKITNEIDGKKYELVKEILLCNKCSFHNKDGDCLLSQEQRRFGSANVCGKLHGIWKEVHDETM